MYMHFVACTKYVMCYSPSLQVLDNNLAFGQTKGLLPFVLKLLCYCAAPNQSDYVQLKLEDRLREPHLPPKGCPYSLSSVPPHLRSPWLRIFFVILYKVCVCLWICVFGGCVCLVGVWVGVSGGCARLVCVGVRVWCLVGVHVSVDLRVWWVCVSGGVWVGVWVCVSGVCARLMGVRVWCLVGVRVSVDLRVWWVCVSGGCMVGVCVWCVCASDGCACLVSGGCACLVGVRVWWVCVSGGCACLVGVCGWGCALYVSITV